MDLWVPTGSAPLPSYAAQLPSGAAPVPTDSARVPSDRGRVPSDLAPACDSGLVPMHSISNARGGHRTQVFSIAAKMLTTMHPADVEVQIVLDDISLWGASLRVLHWRNGCAQKWCGKPCKRRWGFRILLQRNFLQSSFFCLHDYL